MAVYETTRTTGGTDTGLGRIVHRAIAAVLTWNDARVTRKALSRLTDRELDDIGMNRGDIERIRA